MPGELPPEGLAVAIIGKPRYGKSTLARELVEKRRRVLICEQSDAKSEYSGTIRCNSWAEVFALFKRLGPARHTIPFRVAFAPGLTYFPHMCALAKYLGNVTLVIEELGKYLSDGITYPTPPDKDGKRSRTPIPVELMDLAERGAHCGPDALSPAALIVIAQRAMRIKPALRASMERLYVFQQALELDRNYVEGFPGCGPEIVDKIKQLQKYQYLNINSEGECSHEVTRP